MSQTREHLIEQNPARVDVRLCPQGKQGEPDRMHVRIAVTGAVFAAGIPVFKLPLYAASIKSSDVPAQSVHAQDDQGPLRVTGQDEEQDASGFLYHRLYAFDRDTVGAITLDYSAASSTMSERKPGPPFDLIRNNGGLSGSGASFLMVPTLENLDWEFNIDWDLSFMPEGYSAATSLGDANTHYVGRPQTVQFLYYIVGPLLRMISSRPPQMALNGYWLGQPKFNVEAVMTWVGEFYVALAKRLPNSLERPFHVLGREGSIPRSGGAAALNSFLIGYGTEPEPDERIKFLLAHELSHPLAGGMEESEDEYQQWYAEGLAEYYKLMGPYQSGLCSAQEMLDEFSRSTRFYYSGRLINMHNREIRSLFWVDSQARKLPYARGLLYFLALNLRLREKSAGSRSLDDLVNEMQRYAREGRRHDQAAWRCLVVRELGEGESDRIDDMLSGVIQVPPSDIFGPQIVRSEVPMRVIDVGFSPISFRKGQVSGLREDSAAYWAGVREGDLIVQHDFPNNDEVYPQDRPIHMHICRGGIESEIKYFPHGPQVVGYEWILAA